jgi:phospholipid N-methyltransferase
VSEPGSRPAVSFLKEFVSNPQEIGAIAPSSNRLARELVDSVDWSSVHVAVEYGPGHGAVTAALLPHVQGKTFFAIERNQANARIFADRFPEVTLYVDSAEDIVEICRKEGVDNIDAVVSSLPWANFSEEIQDRILDATVSMLAPNGQFTTFAYMHGLALPSGRRFREALARRFGTVERSEVVWRSAPPAVVYHCVV